MFVTPNGRRCLNRARQGGSAAEGCRSMPRFVPAAASSRRDLSDRVCRNDRKEGIAVAGELCFAEPRQGAARLSIGREAARHFHPRAVVTDDVGWATLPLRALPPPHAQYLSHHVFLRLDPQ